MKIEWTPGWRLLALFAIADLILLILVLGALL